jgi:hypothetical protein
MSYIILTVENLDISSSYARLDSKVKAVLDTWLILMSSEKSRGIRQAATIQWVAERERLTKETPKVIKSQNPLPSQHIDYKSVINLNFLSPPRLRASIPDQTSRLSPPPYSAATASTTTNNGSPSLPLQEKCTTSIRRTAQIPPKESIAAEGINRSRRNQSQPKPLAALRPKQTTMKPSTMITIID